MTEAGESVCEVLRGLEGFGSLERLDREALQTAAELHDIGEPLARRDEEGRLRGPGPSMLGARAARRLLHEAGAPFGIREAACALIRFQHLPGSTLAPDLLRRRVLEISIVTRCDRVALLAEAIAIVAGHERELAAVAHFRDVAGELGCLDRPFPFPSPHSRFHFFRRPGRNPFYHAHDDTRGEVVILAGLPGSGKSTWIAGAAPAGYELVGLDEMREEMGIGPTENQGPVVQATRDRAKRIMGDRGAPRSLIWNATNLSRRRREPILALCDSYLSRPHRVCGGHSGRAGPAERRTGAAGTRFGDPRDDEPLGRARPYGSTRGGVPRAQLRSCCRERRISADPRATRWAGRTPPRASGADPPGSRPAAAAAPPRRGATRPPPPAGSPGRAWRNRAAKASPCA